MLAPLKTLVGKDLTVRPGTIHKYFPGTYHSNGATEISSDEKEVM